MINNHCRKHKVKIQKEAHERYQSLSEEENEKRRKKVRDRYQNLPEEEKETSVSS